MKNYTYKTKNDKSKNKKTKKLSGGDSSNYINYYLKNLRIKSKQTNIKDIIYNKSFEGVLNILLKLKNRFLIINI